MINIGDKYIRIEWDDKKQQYVFQIVCIAEIIKQIVKVDYSQYSDYPWFSKDQQRVRVDEDVSYKKLYIDEFVKRNDVVLYNDDNLIESILEKYGY